MNDLSVLNYGAQSHFQNKQAWWVYCLPKFAPPSYLQTLKNKPNIINNGLPALKLPFSMFHPAAKPCCSFHTSLSNDTTTCTKHLQGSLTNHLICHLDNSNRAPLYATLALHTTEMQGRCAKSWVDRACNVVLPHIIMSTNNTVSLPLVLMVATNYQPHVPKGESNTSHFKTTINAGLHIQTSRVLHKHVVNAHNISCMEGGTLRWRYNLGSGAQPHATTFARGCTTIYYYITILCS